VNQERLALFLDFTIWYSLSLYYYYLIVGNGLVHAPLAPAWLLLVGGVAVQALDQLSLAASFELLLAYFVQTIGHSLTSL